MTSQEAFKYKCKPGYWLENVATLGEGQDWQEKIEPPTVDVTDSRLFGYERDTFLAKQYR